MPDGQDADRTLLEEIEFIHTLLAARAEYDDALERRVRALEVRLGIVPQDKKRRRHLWALPAALYGAGRVIKEHPTRVAASAAVVGLAVASLGMSVSPPRHAPEMIASPPCCARLLPPKVPIPVTVHREAAEPKQVPAGDPAGKTVGVRDRETNSNEGLPPVGRSRAAVPPEEPPPSHRKPMGDTCLVDTELGLLVAEVKLVLCTPR